MAKTIDQAVREVCLWLPEAEEFVSHGSPNFRVRGKTFATYSVNHHGDGRISLWLNAPAGAQALYVKQEPKHFFVPPYVGPRGWLGVNLDKGIAWSRVAKLVREAYEKVAPPALTRQIGNTITIKPPTVKPKPEDIDPLKSKRAQAALKEMRKRCLRLPESSESNAFGMPIWRAGKKTFAWLSAESDHVAILVWVGVERQRLFTADERFKIPAYMGHNGWISFKLPTKPNWGQVEALILDSYRHFALKRMLDALGPDE
ncbi:MAG: MmcQ/YjbR family DNA-binding protein [Povalibacter sp.]